MARIADIAEYTGLSPSTVSRCLNGHPHVSAEASAAIHKAVRDLHYIRNSSAVALRAGRTFRFAFLVPTTAHSYYAELLAGAGEAAGRHGYDVVVRQRSEISVATADDLKRMLATRLIDGAVIATDIPSAAVAPLADGDAPVVSCGQVTGESDLSSVFTDHYRGARAVLDHLFETGRRKIVVVVSGGKHVSSNLREAAGRDFVREHKGAVRVSFVAEDNDDEIHAGVALGEALFSRNPAPDAVFTGADQLAAGVLIAAGRHGVAIPRDLAVVGYDDQSLSQALGLSSVYQPTFEMGARAVDLLVTMIGKRRSVSGFEQQRVELPFELRVRETS